MKYNERFQFHRTVVKHLRPKLPDELNKRVSDADVYDTWRGQTDMPPHMEAMLHVIQITHADIDAEATQSVIEELQQLVDARKVN